MCIEQIFALSYNSIEIGMFYYSSISDACWGWEEQINIAYTQNLRSTFIMVLNAVCIFSRVSHLIDFLRLHK